MNWFIVVYFIVNGSWIEVDKLNKEGWSPIEQSNYNVCIEKINESDLLTIFPNKIFNLLVILPHQP